MLKKNKCVVALGPSTPHNSKFIHSPSPDKKSANRVQPTHPPIQQIDQYYHRKINYKIDVSHRYQSTKNLKKDSYYREIVEEEGIDVEEQFWRVNEHEKIVYLLKELGKTQEAVKEYQGLAVRNKRLEQQMCLLLQELQTIHEEREKQYTPKIPKTISTPSTKSKPKRQINFNQEYDDDTYINQLEATNSEGNQEHLYSYIESMENTIADLKSQVNQLQADMHRNMRKDVGDMQQRLMNYIFSLEEKLTDMNHKSGRNASNKIQEFRIYDKSESKSINLGGTQTEQMKMQKSQFERVIVSEDEASSALVVKPLLKYPEFLQKSSKKKDSSSSQSNLESVCTPGFNIKKYSNGSHINLDISESSNHRTNLQQPIQFDQNYKLLSSRKSNLKYTQSNPNIQNNPHTQSFICRNCIQYLKKIKELETKIFTLETDLIRSKQSHGKIVSNRMIEQLNLLQSQVDVMVEESSVQEIEDALGMDKAPKIKIHDASIIHESLDISKQYYPSSSSGKKSKGERFYILSEVRKQLTNLLQQIQEVIHFCESEEQKKKGATIVEELTNRINLQAHQIVEYEEDLGRMRLEIEEANRQRQKMEKMIKLRVREQEQYPSFRMITQPISCFDHKLTKKKLDHILESIKNFQKQVNCKSAPGLGLKKEF